MVDEVHASDQYMAELLRALLDHHLNVEAMLCCCRQPSDSLLDRLLQKSATPHMSFEDAVSAPYPALTLANGNFISTKSHKQRSKVVSFQTKQYMFQTQQIIEDILPALRAGARVLIVLNTVGRVIDVFRDIWANPDIPREWLFQCSGQYCPHHGRYAPPDRMLLDRMVTAQFGKEAPPGPLLWWAVKPLNRAWTSMQIYLSLTWCQVMCSSNGSAASTAIAGCGRVAANRLVTLWCQTTAWRRPLTKRESHLVQSSRQASEASMKISNIGADMGDH